MAVKETAIWIIWRGHFEGVSWVVNLPYFSDTEYHSANPSDAAEACYDDHWSVLQPLIHEICFLDELDVSITFQDQSYNKQWLRAVGENGDIVGPNTAMPPNVGVNIIKMPDNSTKDPVDARDFLKGRVMFPGITEAQNVSGLLDPAYVADWNTFGEALEELEFDVSGTPRIFKLGMNRNTTQTLSAANCYVSETYAAQKLGTRNSRKR